MALNNKFEHSNPRSKQKQKLKVTNLLVCNLSSLHCKAWYSSSSSHFKGLFSMYGLDRFSLWLSSTHFDFVPDLKSLSTTCYQVFRGLPFLCCPSTTMSLHFFTTLSSLHLSTWPNYLKLPLLSAVPNAIKAKSLPQLWRQFPILQGYITSPFYHSHIIVLQSQ